MNRCLVVLLSLLVLAPAAEARSRSRKAEAKRETTRTAPEAHAAPRAPGAPVEQGHHGGPAHEGPWPVPHTGPTHPAALEHDRPEHGVGHPHGGSYNVLGNWIWQH